MSAVVLMCVISFLGGFTMGTIVPGDHEAGLGAEIPAPDPSLPAETRALSGTWERAWGRGILRRIVVETVHQEWGIALLAWGETPGHGLTPGAMRVRAKVLPGGQLHVGHPFRMTFTLSNDGLDLVGTRIPGDPRVSVVLHRLDPDTALASLAIPAP
jgi:hypothetical protein